MPTNNVDRRQAEHATGRVVLNTENNRKSPKTAENNRKLPTKKTNYYRKQVKLN